MYTFYGDRKMREMVERKEMVGKAIDYQRTSYRDAWKELKVIIRNLKTINQRDWERCLKEGRKFMAEVYNEWAREDDYILKLMSDIEKRYNIKEEE